MIVIGNSPNTERDDQLLALRLLLQPWTWRQKDPVHQVEEWFRSYFAVPYGLAVDSGRSGEYLLLQALGIGQGDEVLVPGFTCVAVPNSVIWTGATPIYVDIDPTTFNIASTSLEKKITKRTKAIIVQHTFGRPVDMAAITKIAKKHKLLILEDCAHALGATYKGKKVGTFGDAAFFSFGRDKVISSVAGGMISPHGKHR